MPDKKNLCAMLPIELHRKVTAAKTVAGLSINEYVAQVLTDYYEWKENGGKLMVQENGKTRTLAFQISEDLFQRIKAHLERETARTGKKFTQRDFVIGLIEAALTEAERETMEDSGGTAEELGQPDDTEPDSVPEETGPEAPYEDGGDAEDGVASQYPEEG